MAPGQPVEGTGPEWGREGFLSCDPGPYGGLAGVVISGPALQGGDTKVFPGLWEFWTQNSGTKLGPQEWGGLALAFVELSFLGVFPCFSSGHLALAVFTLPS